MSVLVACLIPAYQVGGSVATVATGLRASLPDALLIGVDDGSTDATAAMLRATCDVVVRFPLNRGKGAALRAGTEVALEEGASSVVTIDADGQHDPVAAPSLVSALVLADIAIGVRERVATRMPLGRRVTNGASSLAMSACAGTALRDPQSGYRAYRRAVLEQVAAQGDRYEYESDLLLGALRAGFRVAEVSVPTVYGPPSHFMPLADSARVVRTIGRHCLGALRARARGSRRAQRDTGRSAEGLVS
jgi:glycosyltransferase involved in cell wall biosynthesis